MKLIDLVRATRENGHRYFAVDKIQSTFSYDNVFKPYIDGNTFDAEEAKFIGVYELTCNWRHSLVDVTKLKGVK